MSGIRDIVLFSGVCQRACCAGEEIIKSLPNYIKVILEMGELKSIRRVLLILATVMLAVPSALAYDFAVDGIYYNITSSTDLTVCVNGADESCADANIPSTVTYNSVTYSVIGINSYAFSWCDSLTSVTIPSSVTTLYSATIYKCPRLRSVILGEGLTLITNQAISGCDALTEIYSMNPTPPTCQKYAFDTITYSIATLHVPEVSVNDYKSTSPWSNFTSIVGDAESGIENVETDALEPAITARDGIIEVSGIDSGAVSVYSTSGALVATGEAGSAINVPGNGIYIVRVNAGGSAIVSKVAVR